MIRCAWCGAENYAIDMWCTRCQHHLDWKPARGRRRAGIAGLGSLAAVAGVMLAMALPAAAWMNGSLGHNRIMFGTTAVARRPAPSTSATVLAQPTPSPTPTPTPDTAATPTAAPTPTAEPTSVPEAILAPVQSAGPVLPPVPLAAVPVTGGNPVGAINAFYRAVTAHQFGAAATLWTAAMRAEYPPPVYIDQRFAGTQQIGATSERVISEAGGTAVVYVDVHELDAGQVREWVGTWQLIDTPSGWLLNSPDLRAG